MKKLICILIFTFLISGFLFSNPTLYYRKALDEFGERLPSQDRLEIEIRVEQRGRIENTLTDSESIYVIHYRETNTWKIWTRKSFSLIEFFDLSGTCWLEVSGVPTEEQISIIKNNIIYNIPFKVRITFNSNKVYGAIVDFTEFYVAVSHKDANEAIKEYFSYNP